MRGTKEAGLSGCCDPPTGYLESCGVEGTSGRWELCLEVCLQEALLRRCWSLESG